ncbi:DUF2760 domain-containing protein [Rhodopirellula sp. P2]|uniref:DUF2760 domain-containing protein n=1 Tax=Rhodopirellula sp. P2 TaxID=2127060 RepID=UPI00236842FB|nr:DUF2760 domain-containing protein [Rhodopirellula sp. P2]WDQ18473.1 DUF2760 domain-containing protein [Rhodopirellula sp. P2]
MFDRQVAERVALALDGVDLASQSAAESTPAVVEQKPLGDALRESGQSDAITLLAALQRDARLVDLIHENLDQYGDDQVGAAARPCLKQCRQTLDRLLGIVPLVEVSDGQVLPVDVSTSSARLRWVGESSGASQGKVVHHGWVATQVQLPAWSGSADDALVIAPAQVQAP